MTCQKSARARRGLAHPKSTGGGVNEPDPPLATAGQMPWTAQKRETPRLVPIAEPVHGPCTYAPRGPILVPTKLNNQCLLLLKELLKLIW